jgi:hypothetical protein
MTNRSLTGAGHAGRALEMEIAHLQACGYEHLSVKEYAARFAALGYMLDRSLDCRAPARYLESGRSYPCCSTGLKEIDTGVSAWHYRDARRDDNFKAMQALRSKVFAVSRNAILGV